MSPNGRKGCILGRLTAVGAGRADLDATNRDEHLHDAGPRATTSARTNPPRTPRTPGHPSPPASSVRNRAGGSGARAAHTTTKASRISELPVEAALRLLPRRIVMVCSPALRVLLVNTVRAERLVAL